MSSIVIFQKNYILFYNPKLKVWIPPNVFEIFCHKLKLTIAPNLEIALNLDGWQQVMGFTKNKAHQKIYSSIKKFFPEKLSRKLLYILNFNVEGIKMHDEICNTNNKLEQNIRLVVS